MKKIIWLMVTLLFCVSCTQSQIDPRFEEYQQIKAHLITKKSFDQDFDFQIRVIFNQMDKGYRYDVLIDHAQVDMYDIQAMAYAGESDKKMCPVIGLFDDEPYHLKVGLVDKENHFYKGIQLSGECSSKKSIKVYISYYQDEQKSKKVIKYIEVKE
ncbi:MAG: hypothetical protein KHZ15_12540 [Coprobacillus cateniformis]|uniref:hypothetical protein n=1 Tax=Longibaculum muris TaxID=1796628 RepID=UPI003AB6BB6D|nr:hypothetical protein [Coprobacillus cateniformis]